MNRAGIDLIKSFEGCRLEAYLDVVGIPTIGYGHIEGVEIGQVITQDDAEQLLADDLDQFERAVEKLTRGRLNDNQHAACVCFAYNVGINAFSKSTMLKMILAGDMGGAADQFLRWNKAGGKVIAGLTRRRQAERDLFRTV